MSFVLVVRMKVAEGNEGGSRVIPELATASREEPGCELYIPCRDPEDPRSYLFYEQYRDKAAFEEHGASEHFQRLAAGELFGLMESRERPSTRPSWIEAGRTSRSALPRSAGAAAAARRHRPADPGDPARSPHVTRGRGPARDDPRPVHGPVRAAGCVPLAAARLAPRPRCGARADRRLRDRAGARARGGAADPPDDPGGDRHGTGQRAASRRREGALRRPSRVRDRGLRGWDQRRRDRLRAAPCRSSTRSETGATRCSSSPR